MIGDPSAEVSGFAPAGFGFDRLLASGPFFRVALVTRGDLRFVCKRPAPRFAEEHEALRALDDEHEALVRLERARVAAPRSIARERDARGAYLVSTYVSGVALATTSLDSAPSSEDAAARLVQSAFGALADVHQAGVVHGDPSPANVLLQGDSAILIDFGLARFSDAAGELRPREVRGTVDYLAPEVARGETNATFASDVFALAATLNRVFTGKPPRPTAPSFAAALIVAAESPPDPSALESRVPGLGEALATRPTSRPSAREIARLPGRAPSW